MTKINKSIKGNNKKNKLTNRNSGYTAMYGKKGDDTYVVTNIANSVTDIEDTAGKDTLEIQNIKGNDLVFAFDVMLNESDDIYDKYGHPFDELIIAKKSLAMSVANKIIKFTDTAALKDVPQKGAVLISDYFGNTNDIQSDGEYGKQYGNGYIENIYSKDKNGVKYSFDFKSYIDAVVPKVKNFLIKNGYNSASEAVYNGSSSLKKELLSIYTDTAKKYEISGSNKNDSINGDSLNDKITGGSGNDKIKGYGGDDKIDGDNGNDKLYGGAGNDVITGGKGNDKIYGEAGDDKIYGNKGDDTINAGKGTNYIYFSKKDGKDTVISGGGVDTLVFDNEKLSKIKLKMSGKNLIIKYTGGQITLKNYEKGNHSAQFIKVQDKTYSINNMLFNDYDEISDSLNMFKSLKKAVKASPQQSSAYAYSGTVDTDVLKSDIANWTNTGEKSYADVDIVADSVKNENSVFSAIISDQSGSSLPLM